jgi:glycosyltransferase involved in cell wall biosynthesis
MKKKIVIFTPTLNIGGIERVLLTYAKGLRERGYNVIYLTCSDKKDFQFEYDVNFVNLGVSQLRKSLWSLILFLLKNKPDIILTANEATLIIFIAKLFSRCSAKIITSQHNYYNNNSEVGLRQKFIIRYIFPLCDNIIAVSIGISSMLINQFKLNPNKVVTIYNPLDIEIILQSANVKVCNISNEYILFVGRLNPVKNLPLLFAAFKIFHQNHQNVDLIIIGDGYIKKELELLISELGLDTVIHLIGIKSNPFPFIKQAKIVALSSLTEALPTILLESLVLGKTIVSTPTHGAIDILKNGTYGYLSDSLIDVNSFANMLECAYNHPIDEEILTKLVKQNYELSLKIVEIENLWSN